MCVGKSTVVAVMVEFMVRTVILYRLTPFVISTNHYCMTYECIFYGRYVCNNFNYLFRLDSIWRFEHDVYMYICIDIFDVYSEIVI